MRRVFHALKELEEEDMEQQSHRSTSKKFVDIMKLSSFGSRFYKVEELSEAFLFVTQVSKICSIQYAIAGAIATGIWGVPRFTNDLDIIASIKQENLPCLINYAKSAGFEIRLIPEKDPDLIRIKKKEAALDFILVKGLEYLEEVLKRAILVDSPYGNLPFVSAEDSIVLKLIAGRTFDMADVERVMKVRKDSLDMPYIRHWAEVWKVSGRLEEVLKRLGV